MDFVREAERLAACMLLVDFEGEYVAAVNADTELCGCEYHLV